MAEAMMYETPTLQVGSLVRVGGTTTFTNELNGPVTQIKDGMAIVDFSTITFAISVEDLVYDQRAYVWRLA
jgi:hypothetical protein